MPSFLACCVPSCSKTCHQRAEPRHRTALWTRRSSRTVIFSPFQVVAYVPLATARSNSRTAVNTFPARPGHTRATRAGTWQGRHPRDNLPCADGLSPPRARQMGADIKTIFSHCVYNAPQCHTSRHISLSVADVFTGTVCWISSFAENETTLIC